MRLDHSELLLLQRMNTPTIYNGWEQVTKQSAAASIVNQEEVRDFTPQMGAMAGYAVTLVIEPSNVEHRDRNSNAWHEYRRYVASVPGPKIVVVQDLDKPAVIGSAWGEVNASIHRALGCLGVICDGAVRDVDEMTAAGFKALARRLCVGHAYAMPVRWNCEVNVFGTRVQPGQLIHADKHGFIAIPREDEKGLLEAAIFMDQAECRTMIPAAKGSAGLPMDEVVKRVEASCADFGKMVNERYGRKGEW